MIHCKAGLKITILSMIVVDIHPCICGEFHHCQNHDDVDFCDFAENRNTDMILLIYKIPWKVFFPSGKEG